MAILHPLARSHLFEKKNTLSGMPGRELILSAFIQLNQNVNYFSQNEYKHYSSDFNSDLAKKYIDFLKFEYQSKGDPSELSFLTPDHVLFISSSLAIDFLIRVFCEPKQDQVLICNPTFPLYAFCASNHGCKVVDVPLQGAEFDQLSIATISNSHAKLLFLPVPNNPIGSIIHRPDLLKLLAQFKGISVIDEAYIEFSLHPSYLAKLSDFPNLAILRSFSKSWGLAGIRCGVLIANPLFVESVRSIIPPCFFPTPIQDLVDDILSDPMQIVKIRS